MSTPDLIGLDGQQGEVVGPVPVHGAQVAKRRKARPGLEGLRCCGRSQQCDGTTYQSGLRKAQLGLQNTLGAIQDPGLQ